MNSPGFFPPPLPPDPVKARATPHCFANPTRVPPPALPFRFRPAAPSSFASSVRLVHPGGSYRGTSDGFAESSEATPESALLERNLLLSKTRKKSRFPALRHPPLLPTPAPSISGTRSGRARLWKSGPASRPTGTHPKNNGRSLDIRFLFAVLLHFSSLASTYTRVQ
jgi:hypothetical protein